MQKVNSPEKFRTSGRLAVVEGRNAAVRLCEALKRHLSPLFTGAHEIYIVEASDEGSIAYAVKVAGAGDISDASVAGLRRYAQAWLDCLEAHAVYEHLATVEVIYESQFLRQAIENIFRPDRAREVLTRLETAYVVAKRAAGVALKGPFFWFSPECRSDDGPTPAHAAGSFVYDVPADEAAPLPLEAPAKSLIAFPWHETRAAIRNWLGALVGEGHLDEAAAARIPDVEVSVLAQTIREQVGRANPDGVLVSAEAGRG